MEWIEGERLRTVADGPVSDAGAPNAANAAAAGVPGTRSIRRNGSTANAAAGDGGAASPGGSPGVSASDAVRRAEALRLVEVGVQCSLEQMLEEVRGD